MAFSLFMVMSLASTTAVIRMTRMSNATQDRVAATSLARQKIELLRSQNASGRALDSAALTSGAFTVTPRMTPAANQACAIGQRRALSVTVSWSGGQSVRVDTVLAC